MNKEIIKTLFPEQYERIEEGKCATCGKEIDWERAFEDDEIGMREFLISGLCLNCQNSVFKEKDE